MTALRSTEARRHVCRAAMTWLETPYRHQASRKGVGCDCLGLVRGVWREVVGPEPESAGAYAMDWAEAGGGEALLEAAQRHFVPASGKPEAGQLVLFRWRAHLPAKHAGIMVGERNFIHAYERAGVVISSLVPQWRRRIAGVFDFPTGG
ncbi:NlpC/P60 family protein [Nitratireductor sp. CH_MIT9313-5]|jgi:NlpC/P60 family putative phage cell wall peptidase|uniref:NlpC/P60 family protein n=1 Tax=Nitratireductor sp. CH_MIT9313-5 TaxID=3107764 RepID=UPI003007FAE2